jgi:hypothetical protein
MMNQEMRHPLHKSSDDDMARDSVCTEVTSITNYHLSALAAEADA